MSACFGGWGEGHPDVAIWGASCEHGAWTAPTELARETEIAAYNPVLFYTRDHRLWLYYKFGPHPDNWTAARRWSTDDGKTWSPVEYLPAGLYGPIRAKPLVLSDGTIVSATSVESYRSWAAWIERSVDNGRTWTQAGSITVPREFADPGPGGDAPSAVPGSSEWRLTWSLIQPSVVQLSGKHFRLYARSTAQIGKICVADSMDNGVTWTQARPLDLPNPNSGIDALARRDGRVVLVTITSPRAVPL